MNYLRAAQGRRNRSYKVDDISSAAETELGHKLTSAEFSSLTKIFKENEIWDNQKKYGFGSIGFSLLLSSKPELKCIFSPSATPRDGNCLLHALSDGILFNDAFRHTNNEEKQQSWSKLLKEFKFYTNMEDADHVRYLRTRFVFGASEWLSGMHGSKENNKQDLGYSDAEWESIWSSMYEDESWDVPALKDEDGRIIKENHAPELFIKYAAHDLQCNIIVFDLQNDTVRYISGNILKENNVIFDSPLLMYSTGSHFQSVFQTDHEFFIKYSLRLEAEHVSTGSSVSSPKPSITLQEPSVSQKKKPHRVDHEKRIYKSSHYSLTTTTDKMSKLSSINVEDDFIKVTSNTAKKQNNVTLTEFPPLCKPSYSSVTGSSPLATMMSLSPIKIQRSGVKNTKYNSALDEAKFSALRIAKTGSKFPYEDQLKSTVPGSNTHRLSNTLKQTINIPKLNLPDSTSPSIISPEDSRNPTSENSKLSDSENSTASNSRNYYTPTLVKPIISEDFRNSLSEDLKLPEPEHSRDLVLENQKFDEQEDSRNTVDVKLHEPENPTISLPKDHYTLIPDTSIISSPERSCNMEQEIFKIPSQESFSSSVNERTHCIARQYKICKDVLLVFKNVAKYKRTNEENKAVRKACYYIARMRDLYPKMQFLRDGTIREENQERGNSGKESITLNTELEFQRPSKQFFQLKALTLMAREERNRVRKLKREARKREKEDTEVQKLVVYIEEKKNTSEKKNIYNKIETHGVSEEECTEKGIKDVEKFKQGLDSKQYLYFKNSMMRKLSICEQRCNKGIQVKHSKLSKEWLAKSFDGRDIVFKYKKEIVNRIKIIEIQITARNICNIIVKGKMDKINATVDDEMHNLDNELEYFSGKGKPEKDKSSAQKKTKLKALFTGMCAVDAIINLFRCTGLSHTNNHNLCDQKEKCTYCILRSALCKANVGKGVKKYVEIPEIKNNLQMFFATEEEKLIHIEGQKQNISLKKTLDTLLGELKDIEEFDMKLLCTKCKQDINTKSYFLLPNLPNDLNAAFGEAMSNQINKHQEKSPDCMNADIYVEKYPNTILMMKSPETLKTINEKFLFKKEIYQLAGQISYRFDHFYTRIKNEMDYYKIDGTECIKKNCYSNPKYNILIAYRRKQSQDNQNVEDPNKFIYSSNAIAYFRKSTDKYKEQERDKYKKDQDYREKKVSRQRDYEKTKYDTKPESREEKMSWQRDYENTKYDTKPESREEKLSGQRVQKKEKYEKYEDFRNKMKQYSKTYYAGHNEILRLIKKENDCHDSGMDFLCISCLRLHSRGSSTKYCQNQEIDEKVLLLPKTRNTDGNYYKCETCRKKLRKGLPKLNFQNTWDLNNISNIPDELPTLNLMEQYLLKLTIPFIRVAHVPRTPNLKLMGGSVCIQANISHTVEKLQIRPENIIPVSFKRKQEYRGHYMEQVVNKEKVFQWLTFLKHHNPLYKDVAINLNDIERDIQIMSDTILDELVIFDDKRCEKACEDLEDQLINQNIEKEKVIIESVIQKEFSDSEDDETDPGLDAIPELLDEIEVNSNDTFLYHVNELSLEEKTLTNGIATLIDNNEKRTYKIADDVKDEFAPEYDEFLFKDDDISEDLVEDELNTKESAKTRKTKDHVTKSKKEKATVVAPGENQPFDNVFKFQEEKCFPDLFPKGFGGYASTYMETGLGFSNYCKMRLTGGVCITDKDVHDKITHLEAKSAINYERFRRDHHYMMFLLLVLDSINMKRAQATAFRKVTRLRKYEVDSSKITEVDRNLLERRNMGYRTFKESHPNKSDGKFCFLLSKGDRHSGEDLFKANTN